MNIPVSWLKEFVDITCDVDELAERLTMSGSKVEAVHHMGNEITNVVVGKIIKIEKHPDADKLVVAQLDIGKDAPVQIITAATNVFEGAYIPVALHGAILAGGQKITKGKIRGQASEGMMCSIEELGFTIHDYPEAPDNGIYIFENAQKPGADPLKILEIRDDIIEFELTSNRPDCFSIIGMARETAATLAIPLKFPKIKVYEELKEDISKMIKVEILNNKLCPRYIARVVKDVKIGPSPQWMRHRLTACGVRPINNIVDITNYVMLELGQPMHAFDINTISGGKIVIRNAAEGEAFTTLDGVERKLDASMLVIADKEKAVAVAGVMGGENSMITGDVSTILFESANFNGTSVRVTAKKLGMRTDASSKFEKGIDPNLAEIAINRAVQLVEVLGCGKVVAGMVDCYPNKREPRLVGYLFENINTLLGTSISGKEMIEYLNRLEIKTGDNFAVIPTFRPDIEEEADIAEEVARLYGYDRIPTTMTSGTPTQGKRDKKQKILDIIKSVCNAAGLCEAYVYTFESPKVFSKLEIENDHALRGAVKISNPLGEDYSVMRTTSLGGIMQSLSTNYNRRNEEAYLYEIGKTYMPKELPLKELPVETLNLTIGMYGGKTDFYSLKGILENIFETLSMPDVCFNAEEKPSMHPGRTASVYSGEIQLGFLGEVHPKVLSNYEIGTKAYICAINLDELIAISSLDKEYKPLPKYPPVERDIALLVKDEINIIEIETAIRERGGKYLESVKLFDVYKGKQIKDGYKSVAYRIIFRAADKTLTDDEVSPLMNKIIKNLEQKLSAELRGV